MAYLGAGVPGLIAEAAEGEKALAALRAVLSILNTGAGAERTVHHVWHLLQGGC